MATQIKKDAPAESEAQDKAEAKPQQKAPTKGMVRIILLKGGWLRHPCGIAIIQGKAVEVPDDSWTNSQVDAGLAKKV